MLLLWREITTTKTDIHATSVDWNNDSVMNYFAFWEEHNAYHSKLLRTHTKKPINLTRTSNTQNMSTQDIYLPTLTRYLYYTNAEENLLCIAWVER